jgi:cytochrome P450
LNYGQSFLGHYDVKEWRQQRNHLMQPMLPLSIFSTMFPAIEECVSDLMNRIGKGDESTLFYGSGKPKKAFNIHELILDTTFKILMRTLIGEEDNFVNENSQSIRWALQRPDFADYEATGIIKQWCRSLLSRAQANKDNIGPLMRELIEIPALYKTTEPGHKGAIKQTHDNLAIISLAGHDTTGSTITFCLMELCAHPEWQDRCRVEIEQVFDQIALEKRGINYADFHKFENLTKCINETLRIWPAVPYGSQREFEHDDYITDIKGEKVTIPKGTMFMIPNYCQGRSTQLWGPDANTWCPSKWSGFADDCSINFKNSNPQFSARNPESPRFHPFTRGPRDCFGKNFAQAEIRMVLSHLLYNYEFSLAEPSKSQYLQNAEQIAWQMAGILKPVDGLWMHITKKSVKARL